MTDELQRALPVLAAAIGGAAVGVERQWSGHATGPSAHFGGVRTFALLGGLAGMAGRLATDGHAILGALLLAAAAALVVAGYVAASRHDVDGTTEVAALVVLAAGLIVVQGGHVVGMLTRSDLLEALVQLLADEAADRPRQVSTTDGPR